MATITTTQLTALASRLDRSAKMAEKIETACGDGPEHLQFAGRRQAFQHSAYLVRTLAEGGTVPRPQ